MNPAEWKTVEDILASALDLPLERQAAYVEQCCTDSPEIRKEVEELLEAYRAAEKCIEPRAGNFDLPEDFFDDAFLGTRIGTYKLVERIGDGGMGMVYRAERDDQQFTQVVAVKLVRAGLHDPELLKRLRTERQILALLEHPHIARLLDGGITAGGQPYIVMEYIEGARITDYCKSKNLNIKQRLALFRQICSAVHYAHQRLVVHRDIKPSNILVARDGAPKLLDFGIAKIVDTTAG
ncbi:MAG TPA: serine/threonine-protein kinase, partial [Candidatus Angelobacter sp.]|nr:serine/threonine-protein kinase [Candidatus Angelobacter sp.]